MHKKLKIGLMGFGKTGKAVSAVLLQNESITLEWILKRKNNFDHRNAAEFLGIESTDSAKIFSLEQISIEKILNEFPVDIIIDFSSHSSILNYGVLASKKGITIISAISHYTDEEKVFIQQLGLNTTVFWSPNITLGINFLMFASKLLKKIAPWTDVEIIEEHFKGKEGISGTASKLADSLDLKHEHINSIRAGGIVGKHQVVFGFPFQTVRLTHESIAREAFGTGIIFVVENIKHKEKGFYSFEDILQPYFVA
ncbi:MAG: dihydrodipicolinate reductase [Chitinophagaceae bacterium]|nr:MAG: dihydrodipicolinate reductase [Chitinophagaceae bacterium]